MYFSVCLPLSLYVYLFFYQYSSISQNTNIAAFDYLAWCSLTTVREVLAVKFNAKAKRVDAHCCRIWLYVRNERLNSQPELMHCVHQRSRPHYHGPLIPSIGGSALHPAGHSTVRRRMTARESDHCWNPAGRSEPVNGRMGEAEEEIENGDVLWKSNRLDGI